MSDPTSERARLSARISGRVQGVGFRYTAIDEARRLGVTGWVRNTPDGDVELVAEGERDRLHRLLSWCEVGPPGARVMHVAHQWLAYTDEFDGFHLRR